MLLAYTLGMTNLRIQALIAELRATEKELLTFDPFNQPEPELLENMTDLKKAVDGIRATLWCYLEEKNSDVLPAPALIKMARMNRVVEMFREIRTQGSGVN